MSRQAGFLQGHLDWFHLFHDDLLEAGGGERGTRYEGSKTCRSWLELVNTAPEGPLWQGGFFEMGLQGDRQSLHKREILLIELEKSLASNISLRTWRDHSLAGAEGRKMRRRRRLRKEGKEEGHTWLPEKARFESLEGKKEENLEGSKRETLTVTRGDLHCYIGIFQVRCC